MSYGLESAGSLNVNGQLVPVPMSGAFYPSYAEGGVYRGTGQGPATVPLSYMQGDTGGSSVSATAAANPFHPTLSPLWMAVFALIIGMLGLRYIHWSGK